MFLIAEDNPAMCQLYTHLFSEDGIEYELVSRGDTAIEKLQDKTYCLLIVDYEMPGGNGLQVVEAARSSVSNATTPVIMCTANHSITTIGFTNTRVVHKPIAAQQLLKFAKDAAQHIG